MSFLKKLVINRYMSILNSRAIMHESGRILIPAAFRRALNLTAGEEFVMHIEGEELVLTPIKISIKKAQNTVKQYNKNNLNLTAELFTMRQTELTS